MKNTGRPSEDIFDSAWFRLGKAAHVFQFTDAAKATGRNQRVTYIPPQPCDRLITFEGETFFAEVKSTVDKNRFHASLIRATQRGFAGQILAAGGRYDIFVHSIAHDRWYRVPYQALEVTTGRASMTWAELQPFAWELPACSI